MRGFVGAGNKEGAVSPVIAVILMIALVVVIAAVFAAAVLVFPSAITPAKIVGVTAGSFVSGEESGVRMTLHGGKDFSDLVSVRAEIGQYSLLLKDGTTEVVNPGIGMNYEFSLVGEYEEVTFDNAVTKLTTHLKAEELSGVPVNFVGKFADGTEQVIYMWKFSLPASSSSLGSYGDENYVKVAGYYAYDNADKKTGQPGHGLYLKRVDPEVKEVKITSCNLKDSLSQVYTVGIFKDNSWVFKGDTMNIFVNPKAGEHQYNSETSGLFFTKGTNADALSGTITLEITFNNDTKTEQTLTVDIPARLAVFKTDKYVGEIFGYDLSGETVQVNFSEFPSDHKLDRGYIALVISTGGELRDDIASEKPPAPPNTLGSEYFTAAGHTITKVDLSTYAGDSSAVLNLYVHAHTGTSQAWFFAGSKSVADLLAGR